MVTLVLVACSVLFGAVFLAGFVWNGTTNTHKQRMTRAEAAGFVFGAPRDAESSGLRLSWWRRWFRGRAWGISWSDEMTFGELKRGVAGGDWRRSVRLMQFLMMVGGFLGLVCSITLLIGWSTGPVGFVVSVGIVVYVALQMTLGMRRAR